MVWHFYGKTKTAITSSKNQFRPQFWAQIVAGVETHPYSPFLGPGDHFWQSYEGNQVQKIRHRIHHTILKTAKSTFVPRFSILLQSTVNLEVIALFAWAPEPNSGLYIVKSAMRLINSGSGTALCSLSLRATSAESRPDRIYPAHAAAARGRRRSECSVNPTPGCSTFYKVRAGYVCYTIHVRYM